MTSSQFHSKNKMGDEFYSILKLVSGEEIFALVCVDETDDEPILILHTPIKMKTLNNMGSQLNYIKVTPWMDMTDEDMLRLIMWLNDLPEYRKKQIAILLMSTCLNTMAQDELAGFMSGLAREIVEKKPD